MVEIIDLVSDTEVTPRLRRSRPRPVANDAELSIVAENIQPVHAASPPPRPPPSSAPPGADAAAQAAPPTASKRNRRAADESAPQVVALKRGINPLQDYVHPRFSCTRVPFKPESAANFCPKCFCFVCDINAAQCQKWADHCGAIDNEEWKRKRRDVRKATRRYDRGVDRLAKEIRRREKRARHEHERRSLLQALGEDRDFAAVMAEQAEIVSQYRGVSANSPHLSLPSPPNCSPRSPLAANPTLTPFQRAMNAGDNLASTLPVLPPGRAGTIHVSTGLLFPDAALLHGAPPLNTPVGRAPSTTALPSAPVLESPDRTDSNSSENGDQTEECEDSGDGIGLSQDNERQANLHRHRVEVQRLLDMQRRFLRARVLRQENEQSAANADAAKVGDRTSPKRHALANSARGRTSRPSLHLTPFAEPKAPFVEEAVIDRSRQKKRRRARTEDRSSRKDRAPSDSHSRPRKHARPRRSNQA
ncbi:hypothetical protein FGB62_29g05 [Gracilaria domingensis]|nr:hypothetical protein FGB62_29g05 [Gracilaria domingensis]